MSQYQIIVHYHFKRGMEEEGLRFLETELMKHARDFGCHYIEFCQNERDTTEVLGLAIWNSIDEARKFQSKWHDKEKKLISFCTNPPRREVFKVRSSYTEKEKARKVA